MDSPGNPDSFNWETILMRAIGNFRTPHLKTNHFYPKASKRVYSFDLFDTVLSRKTGTPKGIFRIMQEILAKQMNSEKTWIGSFYDLRIQAEQAARKNTPDEEISLNEIYQTMSETHPDIPAETLAALEMETELTYSFGIRETVNTIHFLLDLGKRVILISDMYLPLPLIRKMLNRISPRLSALPIYLSSEQGVMKRTGNLFRHVLEKENLAPEELLHTGNDPWTDRQIPENLGIRTHVYTGSALLAPEKLMLIREESLYAQLMCGASRYTRLTAHDTSDAYRTGATFSGPLFYTCVRPILERAAGTRNALIHFLARDGYILKIIADEILSICPLPVRTNYFYASRETLIMPSIQDFSERLLPALQNLLFLASDETIETLSEKLYLSPKAIQEIRGGKEISEDQKITEKELTQIFSRLVRSNHLSSIREACAKKRILLLQYIKEQGFHNASNFIVDIGWTGNTQTALRNILDTIPTSCEILLCFGCVQNPRENKPFEFLTRLPAGDLQRICTSLELFCQADHGKTIGYEQKDGRIQPLFRPVPPQYPDWPFKRYYSGIRSFSSNFTLLLRDFDRNEKESESRLRKALLNILKRPPLYIARSVGSILYTHGVLDGQPKEAAPPFTCKMLMQYFLHRNAEITNWYEGSLARSNLRLIRLNASFFLLIRKMTNVFIWLKRDGIAATCREAVRQLKTIGKRG